MSKRSLVVFSLIIVIVGFAVVIIYHNSVETVPFHGSKHPPKPARLSQSDVADKIRDLESKIDYLESKNKDLESRIDDLEGIGVVSRIYDLESKIDDLETQISRLKDRPSYR
jgi:peptidoglycan hydrolase CwlO-like protein